MIPPPEELVLAVNLSAGRPIWRPTDGASSNGNLVTAAREAGASHPAR
jgi:hypothetical protein